ncbi:MAG TPA: MFS transporter [Dehalococcoidia bacterium]|nr:MFS transporter [Dehalococcoidia bacterium]
MLFVDFMDEWVSFFPAGSLNQIQGDLDLSYGQAGVILACFGLGGLLGTPIGGLAADFVDRRKLLTGGAFAYAASMALFGLSDGFWVMVLAALLWGASSDPFTHPADVVLAELDPDMLETNVARGNFLGSLGDILSPLTVALVFAVGLDWRILMFVGAAGMAAYGFWFLTLEIPPLRQSRDGHTPWSSLLSVVRDRRVILAALVITLFSTLDEPFAAFVILFLRDEGYGATTAGIMAMVFFLAAALGFILVPWLTRRFSARGVRFGLALLMLVGILAVLTGLIGLLVPGLFLTGAAGAAFYSIMYAGLLRLRPGQVGATGTVTSYIDTLALAFPPLVGVTADAAGLHAGLALYGLIPIGILILLLVSPAANGQLAATESVIQDK